MGGGGILNKRERVPSKSVLNKIHGWVMVFGAGNKNCRMWLGGNV